MSEEKALSRTLLVGVDFSKEDKGVLIVGEKTRGQNVKIINAFSGKEAHDIYDKLVTPAQKEDVQDG